MQESGVLDSEAFAPSGRYRMLNTFWQYTGTKASKEPLGIVERVFETSDYFDYYRHYHAFWKLYGIGLPDDVLKKVYYKNALTITPRLPQTGWPR